MAVKKALTNAAKIGILKSEMNRLILKNDGAPVLDATFNKVFNIVVNDKAVDEYFNGAAKLPSNKEVDINVKNMQSFNWSGLFTKGLGADFAENDKTSNKVTKKKPHDISIDHLEPERYEYMVLDHQNNSTWSLKIIDLQKVPIKEDDNIFSIIDKHDYRNPLEILNQIHKVNDESKKQWEVFGTEQDNHDHLILRTRI